MATCPTCRARYSNEVTVCAKDGEPLLPDEAFSAADGELVAGRTVGEYVIEGKLGEGGFGAVYRAVHPLIGKAAAIKVLNRQYSSNPQMVSRFIAEARAVNQIRNRNIIDIFSFGQLDDGRQYYVMELLDGTTLDRYLKERGRLTPEEGIPIFRGLARALDAAHARGIAHRDLKPENVFLVIEDDGNVFPKLLDFGIAKLLSESQSGHKTRTGTPMGTPHYMSPEQCRGKDVDHRTDIYSFGALVHECLTGQVPFDGEAIMDVLVKHTTAPAPPLSTVVPGLSPALDGPVLHMLEKDAAMRPASLSVAVEALAAAATGAGHSVVPPTTPNRGKVTSTTGGGAIGGQKMTPAEIGALVDARTVVGGTGGKTLMGSEAEVPRPASNRSAFFGVAGGMLVAGAAAAFFFMRSGPAPVTAPTSGAPSQVATLATVATVATTAPTPTVAPAESAAVVAPASTEVTLTVQAKPPNAEVWLGKTRLGLASEPLKLKRGDAALSLTIKAPGYASVEVPVTPSQDPSSVSVTLTPVAKKKSELEF